MEYKANELKDHVRNKTKKNNFTHHLVELDPCFHLCQRPRYQFPCHWARRMPGEALEGCRRPRWVLFALDPHFRLPNCPGLRVYPGVGGPSCWALLHHGLGAPCQDLPIGWGLQVPTLRRP